MPINHDKTGRRQADSRSMCFELARSGISLPLIFTPQFIACDEECIRIIRGESELEAPRNDKRFKDPIWRRNAIYRASMQAYLTWCNNLKDQISKVAINDYQRKLLETAVQQLTQKLAPDINPGHSPVQHAYESRGASLVHDLHRMTHDLLTHSLPAHHNTRKKLKAGKYIAATPGAVIHRSKMLELIQYTPLSTEVFHTPLLIIPSPVNRFYLCDLHEKNSLVHYLLRQGFQVYTLSWRNPLIAHKHWNLECYINETICSINELTFLTGQPSINLMGFAAGGLLTAITSSLLAHHSDASGSTNPINSATLAITSLQTFLGSQVGPHLDDNLINAAKTLAQLHDVSDAKELAGNFAWLCPNHLLWNPLVSNYYHGEASAEDDLFYWNNDTQRTTAGLYCDFLSLTNDNPLLEPNKLSFCGIPLDLKNVQCDTYTLAGSCDHITPWESSYQSCLALGGKREFVLVNRGHSRSLVCPIGSTETSYYTHTDITSNSDDWLSEATQHAGTWWPHWSSWLAQRSGEKHPPPRQLGDEHHPKLAPAPGRYVFE